MQALKDAWAAWKAALGVIWQNLVQVIALNLLWLVTAFPIVTAGPATLAAYWWGARVLRDEREVGYPIYFKAFKRFFLKGLVWFVGWVVVLYLAYLNLQVWGILLPPMGAAVVQMVWYYALLFLAAMQPYLLEALTVDEEPWGQALKQSAWQVVANPTYSHVHLVIPALLVYVASRYATVSAVVLTAMILLFWTVVAEKVPWKYGAPPPTRRNIEDVL